MVLTAKRCPRCNEAKPPTEFHRNASRRDGLQARCKACCRAPEIVEARRRYRATPEARKIKWVYHLMRKYGLTLEQWDALLIQQGGRCAACEDPLDGQIDVDHCHGTGLVRGLLCHPCNLAEGLLRSDPARAKALLDYMLAWT